MAELILTPLVRDVSGLHRTLSIFLNQPELISLESAIAVDVHRDEITNSEFYKVEVSVSEGERSKVADDVTLLPGMPADIFVLEGDRTVLTYLVKPVMDQIERALREE